MKFEVLEAVQAAINLLVTRLNKLQMGETITYDELRTVAALSSLDGSSYALRQARKMLQGEENKVFLCLRGQGLKYITDPEIVSSTEQARKKINRAAIRGLKRHQCTNIMQLSPEEQNSYRVHASLLAVTHDITKRLVVQRLAVRMAETQEAMTREATLEFLMRSQKQPIEVTDT